MSLWPQHVANKLITAVFWQSTGVFLRFSTFPSFPVEYFHQPPSLYASILPCNCFYLFYLSLPGIPYLVYLYLFTFTVIYSLLSFVFPCSICFSIMFFFYLCLHDVSYLSPLLSLLVYLFLYPLHYFASVLFSFFFLPMLSTFVSPSHFPFNILDPVRQTR